MEKRDKNRREGWSPVRLRTTTLEAARSYRDDLEELQEYRLEPILRPNGSPGGSEKPPSIDAVVCRLLELLYLHRERADRQRGVERERKERELPPGGHGAAQGEE